MNKVGKEIKYTHESLVRAVDRIQEVGDFNTRVDASEKAGEILNKALDSMEKQVVEQVNDLENNVENSYQPLKGRDVDNSEFSL